ncbi:MAG: xanthine dehydrogenase family protein subunit M [Dehalococcoidia bacterium]|nr:MAG: xanthine dehydrogenase family protein subunit M [Dehalococcoidia bacterium]
MQALRYARATSIDEAVRMLREGGETARVLAGGTDVIVQARERRRVIDLFVDIKHIPDVMGMTYDAQRGLTVGAAVPLYQVYGNADVARVYPALRAATHVIGGKAIQGRASLGGNLGNSSPAADSIPAMMALDGVAAIAGPNGRREVHVDAFCTGPGRNVLQPGEFIVSLHFPQPVAHSGNAWERFIPRNEMDIAVVNAACALTLEGDVVTAARVALGAVAPTTIMVPGAAEALVGRRLTDDTIAAAGAAAKEAATPIEDMRGTVKQRKHLSDVLVQRVVRAAAEHARSR